MQTQMRLSAVIESFAIAVAVAVDVITAAAAVAIVEQTQSKH